MALNGLAYPSTVISFATMADTTNTTQLILHGINLTSTFGSVHLGILLASIFFGITTMQAYLYFWSYFDDDKWSMKGFVLGLWLLNLLNLIFLVQSEWGVQVLHWARVSELLLSPPSSVLEAVPEIIVVVAVQYFLVRRVWLLYENKSRLDYVVLYLLPIISTWQIGAVIAWEVLGVGKPLTALATPLAQGIQLSARAASVVVDLTVTIYMTRLVSLQKVPAMNRTRQLLFRLAVAVINTGLFTSLVALLTLVVYAARLNDRYWVIFEYPLCTISLSCLLANLNSRNFIRSSTGVVTVIDTAFQSEPTTLAFAASSYLANASGTSAVWAPTGGGNRGESPTPPFDLHIQKDTYIVSDCDPDLQGETESSKEACRNAELCPS